MVMTMDSKQVGWVLLLPRKIIRDITTSQQRYDTHYNQEDDMILFNMINGHD